MHRAGKGIELCIVLSRGLSEPARRGRKLIPEPVEVDPLAPSNEALHVRPAEAEVPKQRVLEDLLPGSYARKGRINQHEPRDAIAMLCRKSETDHVADVVRDEIGPVD